MRIKAATPPIYSLLWICSLGFSHGNGISKEISRLKILEVLSLSHLYYPIVATIVKFSIVIIRWQGWKVWFDLSLYLSIWTEWSAILRVTCYQNFRRNTLRNLSFYQLIDAHSAWQSSTKNWNLAWLYVCSIISRIITADTDSQCHGPYSTCNCRVRSQLAKANKLYEAISFNSPSTSVSTFVSRPSLIN